jgi:hypothetical protein|tara:strand:+ start:191 stop:520 length:330 start_codon:yes stop_codon:yes gene_type:complete
MANNIEVIQAIMAIDSNANVGASGDPYDADAITLTWTSSEISIADIKTKMAELQTAYDNNEYQRDRKPNYPLIAEQLDLLYHDIVADKLDTTGEWAKKIKAVKDANPKD